MTEQTLDPATPTSTGFPVYQEVRRHRRRHGDGQSSRQGRLQRDGLFDRGAAGFGGNGVCGLYESVSGRIRCWHRGV